MCTHLPCPFSVISLIKLVYNACKTISSVRYYVCQREGNGPAGVRAPRSPAHRKVGTLAVDTRESSSPHAHPSTEEHDATIAAHYSYHERPHACMDGWVFVGYVDEHGEEREASYHCRRCADDR